MILTTVAVPDPAAVVAADSAVARNKSVVKARTQSGGEMRMG